MYENGNFVQPNLVSKYCLINANLKSVFISTCTRKYIFIGIIVAFFFRMSSEYTLNPNTNISYWERSLRPSSDREPC